ncbi:MAG: hypothetical protein KAW12_04705 [Candidatus Aminicenantes bacterium]|nr:hypothetical protein [Candidatus Aminicenantes bacterium]
MKAITYEYARKNFDQIFKMVDVQTDGVVIVKETQNFVLIDKELLDSLFESIELSRDKEFVASVKRAKTEMDRGDSFTFEEVFGEEI